VLNAKDVLCAQWQMWGTTSYSMEKILVLKCGGVHKIEILWMKKGKLNLEDLLNSKT